MATISSESSLDSVIFSSVCGLIYVIIIFIISKKTNLFNKIKRNDIAAWNEKYDAKIARKEAKRAAKAARKAEKQDLTVEFGEHDESVPGKHFKQQ
jgi:hypothetical protein